jgi:hypothetical protein
LRIAANRIIHAQTGRADDNPIQGHLPNFADYRLCCRIGTESPKTKDFVVETRQPETRYVPVGTSITRPTPKLNEAAFRQMESGLDTRLSADKAAAEEAKKLGSTPPPAPPKVN